MGFVGGSIEGVWGAGNNASEYGGGIATSGAAARLTVADSIFDANSALPSGTGGALHINNAEAVAIGSGVTISNCRAFVGGGIWWRYMGGNITDACTTCVFFGNTSELNMQLVRASYGRNLTD